MLFRVSQRAGERAAELLVGTAVDERDTSAAGQAADRDAVEIDRAADGQAGLEVGVVLAILAIIIPLLCLLLLIEIKSFCR